MQLDSEVLVVSAFGRGNWLAAELKAQGIPVALMDVSEQLGNWSPEDWEGPFGFYTNQVLTPLQLESLQSADAPVLLNNGFTIWMKEGPIEFKSTLTPHRLKPEAWIYSFFQNFSKLQFRDRTDAIGEVDKTPTMSDFYIRRASRIGLQKSLQWLEGRGVRVHAKSTISDISLLNKSHAGSVEFRSDRPSMHKSEQFVWCLSAEETGMLSASVREKVYKTFHPEMMWSWLRYRLRIESSLIREQLPSHQVIIEDVHLPWTHENCFVLQRTALQEQFDMWMMLPTAQRFNKQYLADRANRAKEILSNRLPGVSVLLQDFPQEHSYTYNQLGPSRFGAYQSDLRVEAKKQGLGNVHVVGPETWESYSPQANFKVQTDIFLDLKKWWDHKEELRKKREEKEQKASARK